VFGAKDGPEGFTKSHFRHKVGFNSSVDDISDPLVPASNVSCSCVTLPNPDILSSFPPLFYPRLEA